MDVGLSPGDFVLYGDPVSAPSQNGSRSPQIFGSCLLWPNGWMDQDGTWYGGRPWSNPNCARWGHSSSPPKKGRAPPIFGPSLLWPNGWMHQDAIWYVGRPQSRRLRRLLLDGDPGPTPKGAEAHPIFGPRLLWPNGCMDKDATWYRGRPRPTRH